MVPPRPSYAVFYSPFSSAKSSRLIISFASAEYKKWPLPGAMTAFAFAIFPATSIDLAETISSYSDWIMHIRARWRFIFLPL